MDICTYAEHLVRHLGHLEVHAQHAHVATALVHGEVQRLIRLHVAARRQQGHVGLQRQLAPPQPPREAPPALDRIHETPRVYITLVCPIPTPDGRSDPPSVSRTSWLCSISHMYAGGGLHVFVYAEGRLCRSRGREVSRSRVVTLRIRPPSPTPLFRASWAIKVLQSTSSLSLTVARASCVGLKSRVCSAWQRDGAPSQ